jgi:hypothetical protein
MNGFREIIRRQKMDYANVEKMLAEKISEINLPFEDGLKTIEED